MIESQPWFPAALCRDSDPELFFPSQGGGVPEEVKELCRSCPVRMDCLAHAISVNEDHGYWGGCSERRRRRIRKLVRHGTTLERALELVPVRSGPVGEVDRATQMSPSAV